MLRAIVRETISLAQENAIYGVSWGMGSSPVLTRTDAAVGMVAAAGVGVTPVVNSFDNAEIYREIREVTDILGNVFVRIPKFYIKKTDNGSNLKTWQVSKRKYSGFYLPYCFWDFANSRELPYIDVGKYFATLSGANKLESIPGGYPLINNNIVQMRGYAQANGAAYQQLDVHTVDMLQTLFYVEFATLHSQSIMAGWTSGYRDATYTATVAENAVNRVIMANAKANVFVVGQPIFIGTGTSDFSVAYGRVITAIDVYDASNKAISFDGAAVNIAVGNVVCNMAWKNGACASVAARSGSLTHNTNGLSPFIYRGIENLWGDLYQFVDGVNITDRVPWVCLNPASYASNAFADPYKQLGWTNYNANGYIKEMGYDANYPFAAFPKTAIGGLSTTYYADYYYQTTGQLIALLGGYWSSWTSSGLSFWALNNSSAGASVVIGARLLRKAL